MGKSKGKKRKAHEIAIATSIQPEDVDLPDGWMQKLLDLGPAVLASILAQLAHEKGITSSQIKRFRIGLPLFSRAKWSEIVPHFDLPYSHDITSLANHLVSISITPVLLPPYFHETIAEVAWRIQDVYQELVLVQGEATQVRFFDMYIVPIVGLFQGRIIDRPGQPTASTAYSSGGVADHELRMIGGGILFVVIKMKQGLPEGDNIARLFLELLSATEVNKKTKFEGLRVYGLLIDPWRFHFFSYDQTRRKFAYDATLPVSPARESFIQDMILVTNKIFSVILSAYSEGLDALVKASPERAPASATSSSLIHLGNSTDDNSGCKEWELALDFAAQCMKKFLEPVRTIEDIEKQSCEAIGLLTKSVRSVPRFSYYSEKEDPSTENELKALARRIVHEKYMIMVEQHVRATGGG